MFEITSTLARDRVTNRIFTLPGHKFSAIIIVAVLFLSGCGGGGGGETFSLNGGPVNGSFSGSTADPQTYSFNLVAGTPYTVALVKSLGETSLAVNASDPTVDPVVEIGFSWPDGDF
jgi:hypothetical protein